MQKIAFFIPKRYKNGSETEVRAKTVLLFDFEPFLSLLLWVICRMLGAYLVVMRFVMLLAFSCIKIKISIPNQKIHKKNRYLCCRFRNNKNEMQQNRMNITATKVCRGSKRFECVLCAPISSIVSFDNIGKTIQQKHTLTRIL